MPTNDPQREPVGGPVISEAALEQKVANIERHLERLRRWVSEGGIINGLPGVMAMQIRADVEPDGDNARKVRVSNYRTVKGVDGDKGEAGAQGGRGDVGDKGEVGDPGEVGDLGEAGDKGAPGDRGQVGDKGAPGIPDEVLMVAETVTFEVPAEGALQPVQLADLKLHAALGGAYPGQRHALTFVVGVPIWVDGQPAQSLDLVSQPFTDWPLQSATEVAPLAVQLIEPATGEAFTGGAGGRKVALSFVSYLRQPA